jgi:GTP cyclohydrolase I
MVREATLKLSSMDNITWFSMEAENYESIHKHSAYASVERDNLSDHLKIKA